MTGRILVVDDIDVNLKLFEMRLHAEYFDVLTARSGAEALQLCDEHSIDLVLLDVMMPEMDGYEVCRRLKAGARTRHLPVILVTALDHASDRVRGLEAGADDFLTKPAGDLQLFSRVKSLLRLKFLTDELRIRADTTASLVGAGDLLAQIGQGGRDGAVLVVDENRISGERLARTLRDEHACAVAGADAAAAQAAGMDLVVVNLAASDGFDPLRFCSQLRALEETRRVPIMLVAGPHEEAKAARGLELGASDYLLRPVDRNELLARARTQIKRRRFDEGLRQSVRSTIELAVVDALTGLHNRRFLDAHLPAMVERARGEDRPLAVLLADIDHFKRINDTLGHDAGDEVLREFARRLREGSRSSDLVCRTGGEEFVIAMPDTDGGDALQIAERIRRVVAEAPFPAAGGELSATVSLGLAMFDARNDDALTLVKRADQNLYAAKRDGRNRVSSRAA